MRHGVSGRKLNRTTSHRSAMFRNMVTSIIKHESIRTTDTMAKEMRKLADRMITLGKKGDLHSRRQSLAYIYEPEVVHNLFAEIAPKYENRNGGYTRILKLGARKGDGAEVAVLELVD